MAADIPRTAADDAADAEAALDAAAAEMMRLRAHLARLAAGGTVGDAHAARRSSSIIAAETSRVLALTAAAAHRAQRAEVDGQLSAVS